MTGRTLTMKESDIIRIRAKAEEKAEPVVRIFRHALIEFYVEGFINGVQSTEDEEAATRRLTEEEEALKDNDEPVVSLKPGAILKRRLRKEEFSTRAWNVLQYMDVRTLGDMVSHSRTDYLKIKSIGKKTLKEIVDYAQRYGYDFNYKIQGR